MAEGLGGEVEVFGKRFLASFHWCASMSDDMCQLVQIFSRKERHSLTINFSLLKNSVAKLRPPWSFRNWARQNWARHQQVDFQWGMDMQQRELSIHNLLSHNVYIFSEFWCILSWYSLSGYWVAKNIMRACVHMTMNMYCCFFPRPSFQLPVVFPSLWHTCTVLGHTEPICSAWCILPFPVHILI